MPQPESHTHINQHKTIMSNYQVFNYGKNSIHGGKKYIHLFLPEKLSNAPNGLSSLRTTVPAVKRLLSGSDTCFRGKSFFHQCFPERQSIKNQHLETTSRSWGYFSTWSIRVTSWKWRTIVLKLLSEKWLYQFICMHVFHGVSWAEEEAVGEMESLFKVNLFKSDPCWPWNISGFESETTFKPFTLEIIRGEVSLGMVTVHGTLKKEEPVRNTTEATRRWEEACIIRFTFVLWRSGFSPIVK